MAIKAETGRIHRERIGQVQNHLEAHLDTSLQVKDLAQVACMAPHHFHRVFRGLVGESVLAHIKRLRLQRAAAQLLHNQIPVTEAAFSAGYDSHEAFSRAFKQHFGQSPRNYREIVPERVSHAKSLPAFREVELREEPVRSIVYRRLVGPWSGVPELWQGFLGQLARLPIDFGQHQLLGLCPDDPDVSPAEKLRFDACITWPAERAVPENMQRGQVPAGRYAVAVHQGSYQSLSETYLAIIGRWLPHTNYQLAPEPCVEYYLNDPQSTPESELRTEVWARLL